MSAIALDPLIAEAKRRARRRRALAAGIVLVAAIATTLVVESRGGFGGGRQSDLRTAPRAAVHFFGRTELKRGGQLIWATNARRVWLTTNGARTWRPTEIPGLHRTSADFLGGLDFIDPAHGWAVVSGDKRLEVARTTDGGRSWRASFVPGSEPRIGSVHFQTRLRGYVDVSVLSSVPAASYKRFASTDGGATWTRVPHPSTLLRRRHAVRVYVPGPPHNGDQIGALERTDDYGRHWTRVSLPGNPDVKELKSSGQRLVAVGLVARPQSTRYQLAMYESDDAGRHWTQRLASPKIQPGGPQDACCFEVSFPSLGAVYALSGSNDVYVTHDAGRTWHAFQPSGLFPLATYEPIDFITARVGLAIRGSMLVRTTDGGRHWAPVGPREPKARKRG